MVTTPTVIELLVSMWSTDYSAGQLLSRRKYNPQGSGTGRTRAEDRLSTLLGPEETGDRFLRNHRGADRSPL